MPRPVTRAAPTAAVAHPPTTPPRSASRTRTRGGPHWSKRASRSTRRAPTSTPSRSPANSTGMVALDDADELVAPRQALERHRVGPRRRLARGTARRAGPVGRRVRQRAGGRRSRSPSSRGCTAASPRSGQRLAHVCPPPRLAHHRFTGELVTDRGDALGHRVLVAARRRDYRCDLLAIVDDAIVTGIRSCPGARASDGRRLTARRGRRRRLGSPNRADRRLGTGDNMAAARRARACARATSAMSHRHVRHRVRGRRRAARPIHAAPSPASPTPPVASSRSCAPSTPRGVTEAVARPAGRRRSTSSTSSPSLRPAGAGGLTLVPYLAGERTPNRPDATGTLRGLRTDSRATTRPGRVRGRRLRAARRARRVLGAAGGRPTMDASCSSVAAAVGGLPPDRSPTSPAARSTVPAR